MNVLILSDYYHPIVKSGAIIVGDLANELTLQGHGVTIITFVDELSARYQDSVENGVRVIRIRSTARKYGMAGRLWAEINYASQIIKTLQAIGDVSPDATICYAPSIFYGKAVRWMKRKNGIEAYLVIRDIFPKWAVDAGIVKKGLLYRFFKYIEQQLYSAVDFIGIEASSDLEYFRQYATPEKIEVLDNWSAPVHPVANNPGASLLDASKINILYGGNMGDAQDLLSLVGLMDHSILGDKAALTFIGEGNQVEPLKKLIAQKSIKGVRVLPAVDRETYLSMLQTADVGLVSLNSQLASHNYPLKMVGYLQFGMPILASVNRGNEIIQLVGDRDIGLASVAGDEEPFNNNLQRMIEDAALRKVQGQNALALFEDRFTVSSAVKQIMRRFSQ